MEKRAQLVAVLVCFLYAGVCMCFSVSSPADSTIPRPTRTELLTSAIADLLGAVMQCVTVQTVDESGVLVRYVRSYDCDEIRRKNIVLDMLAATGRHVYRFVPPGRYVVKGLRTEIGAWPQASPGATACAGHDSESLILDPRFPLGYTPGELMSGGLAYPLRSASGIIAHEAGHASCAIDPVVSKSRAIAAENWWLLNRDPSNGQRVVRLFHDFPRW